MAGLVPAIHVFLLKRSKDVDARHPSTPRLRQIQCQSAEALAKAGTRPGMTIRFGANTMDHLSACESGSSIPMPVSGRGADRLRATTRLNSKKTAEEYA